MNPDPYQEQMFGTAPNGVDFGGRKFNKKSQTPVVRKKVRYTHKTQG
jgi:hypothetical protein